jgi:hypothetical protein
MCLSAQNSQMRVRLESEGAKINPQTNYRIG